MSTNINIEPLSMDNVYQGRAVLVEVLNYGTPQESEEDLGIVTVAELDSSADSTDVASSNLPVRAVIGQLLNELSMKLNITTISITRKIRALSAFGLEEANALPADPEFSKAVGKLEVGRRIPLGRRVNEIEIGNLEEGRDFVAKQNGRVVVILAVPNGTPNDATIEGKAPAVVGGVRIKMGAQATREFHARLYGVEAGKEDMVMDVMGQIKPSSALGNIGENDPIEAEFELTIQPRDDGSFGTITCG